MKLSRIYLWSLIAALAIFIILAAVSCNWPTMAEPHPDWVFNPPAQTEVDTVPLDTILPLEIDTCESFTEYTDPAFVTLYIKFDDPQDSVRWEGGGIQSYDLAEVVTQITSLPAKIDTSPIGMSVLLKGTNNHQQFQLKVFTRIDGAKWYAGTAMQGLILPGATTQYYKETIIEYPSFNQFTFYGVDCTCDESIYLCRQVLKDCHAGREYADLFFLPCQPPQSVRDSLDLYGWERIRALSAKNYVADLRGMGNLTQAFIEEVAKSGRQIIVPDVRI